MKKLFTLLVAFTTVTVCNAQFSKGQVLLGPSVSIGGNFTNTNNTSIMGVPFNNKNNHINFGIGTECIKMKTASTGLGFNFNYGLRSSTNTSRSTGAQNEQKYNQHSFSVGIARAKFYSITEKWLFYYNTNLNMGYSFGKNNYNVTTTNDELKTNRGSLNLSIEPGIAFKLKEHLLLGLKFADLFSGGYAYHENYRKNNLGERSVEKGSDFNLSTSLTSNVFGSAVLNLKWIL